MRIVTWNTWWCFADWEQRQPLLAATLSAAEPDVVLLQETWPEQAERLAHSCGLSVIGYAGGAFDPPVLTSVAPDHSFGNAILADPDRAQLAGTLPIASADDAAPRFGLAAHLDWGATPLLAVSTHLNHIAEAGRVRSAQLDQLRAWTEQLSPDGPVLLGGDLNQTPSSEEYERSISPHWIDLWATTRPDDTGATMLVENRRLTFTDWMADRNPPGAPSGIRLDYLLTRSGLDVQPRQPTVEVRRIDLIGGSGDDWPSDHLGIVADLHPIDPDKMASPEGSVDPTEPATTS